MPSFLLDRRYLITAAAWIVVFIALTYVAVLGIRALPADSPWRLPLAVLPALPMLGGMLLDLHYIRRLDELQQRIALVAIVPGAYAAMSLCVVAWILERLAGVPRLSPMVVFATFGTVTWVAWFVASRRLG